MSKLFPKLYNFTMYIFGQVNEYVCLSSNILMLMLFSVCPCLLQSRSQGDSGRKEKR